MVDKPFVLYPSFKKNQAKMSKKPFDGKFSKDLYILNCLTRGEAYLGDYPKLSKKLKKYFEQQNIQFYSEPETDNLYLIELIRDELQNSEKALSPG